VDDIPDRSVLRQLIEALEKGAGATAAAGQAARR